MTEILAPSGSTKAFFAACAAGADAIYLGLSDFSARKNAENFNFDNFRYYVCYAHLFNVKVYVCVNTLVKNCELKAFYETVKIAYECGADAFIVQDMLLGKALKKAFPKIQLHLSTQSCVNNLDGALLAKEFGFSRVVLARETEIREIKEISKIIETEVFVHGALCTSLSGHCYLSSFIGGNSGNRGLCRQPCRQKYQYSVNSKGGDYALSLSDLCLINRLSELINAGVTSFKIEGRMKNAEYVYYSTLLYKKAINNKHFEKEYSAVLRCFNRGAYTEGYAFNENKSLISDYQQNHQGELFGKILSVKNKLLKTDNNNFSVGDAFKIMRKKVEVGNAICINEGELSFSGNVLIGDLLFITKDSKLIALVEKANKLKKITVNAEFLIGKKPKLSSGNVEVFGEFVLEKAKTSGITEKELYDNLCKNSDYPFYPEKINFSTDGAFVLKSQLNLLRKAFYEKLFYSDNEKLTDALPFNTFNSEFVTTTNNSETRLAIITNESSLNFPNFTTDLVFAPNEYSIEAIQSFINNCKNSSIKKYLYVPAFLNNDETAIIEKLSDLFDGIYVEGLFGISLAKRLNKVVFLGVETNLFNSIDINEIKKLNVESYAVSKELSYKDVDLGGFVFANGSIKVMSLMYCPFKRNCSVCKANNMFQLKDYASRVFNVRRYKITKCRFEIYNESLLTSIDNFSKTLIDLSGVNKVTAQKILDNYVVGVKKVDGEKYTVGNLSRGVN